MPQLAGLFFKTAVVFFIIGIAMGLQMAISGNHSVIGAHAHANLLGWVTMALFGCYLALNPAKAEQRFARLQYYVYTGGVAVMVPSLYAYLTGYPAAEPLVALSSLIVAAGVLMFAVIIYSRAPVVPVMPNAVPAE